MLTAGIMSDVASSQTEQTTWQTILVVVAVASMGGKIARDPQPQLLEGYNSDSCRLLPFLTPCF